MRFEKSEQEAGVFVVLLGFGFPGKFGRFSWCWRVCGRLRSEVLDDVPHSQDIDGQGYAIGGAIVSL